MWCFMIKRIAFFSNGKWRQSTNAPLAVERRRSSQTETSQVYRTVRTETLAIQNSLQ